MLSSESLYSTSNPSHLDQGLTHVNTEGLVPGEHVNAYFRTDCYRNGYQDNVGPSSRTGENKVIFVGNNAENNIVPVFPKEDMTSMERESDSVYSFPTKLFVGQIPRSMEEADISPFFEKFGAIEEVSIIRDKHTGQHRGCAFVTFSNKEGADTCEAELHNQFVFANGRRPVQIRPAGKREDVENKLFVGMLPRNIQEITVRELFQPFGDITGVYMIRSNDGIKKGCAFVKYAQRESALAAIDNMNGQSCVEGSECPLIVKHADTRCQKRARHYQQTRRDLAFNPPNVANITHGSHGNANSNPYYLTAGPPPPVSIFPAHLTTPAIGISQPHTAATAQFTSQAQYHSTYPSAHAAGTPATASQFIYQHVNPYGISLESSPYPSQTCHISASKQRYPRSHRLLQQKYGTSGEINLRPKEGPTGANLFIYHLPHDLTDADLATTFNPFGNVVSAKVYVDRYTGESKGFGFVSYDSVLSAEHAIEQMNGFQIGGKRLKVQHKRINHRPPLTNPAVIMFYPCESIKSSTPVQDIPPSIEILTDGDETENVDQINSSKSSPQNDVDILTRGFATLCTHDKNK